MPALLVALLAGLTTPSAAQDLIRSRRTESAASRHSSAADSSPNPSRADSPAPTATPSLDFATAGTTATVDGHQPLPSVPAAPPAAAGITLPGPSPLAPFLPNAVTSSLTPGPTLTPSRPLRTKPKRGGAPRSPSTSRSDASAPTTPVATPSATATPPRLSHLRRAASAAMLRAHEDADVESALAEGLLTEADVNVYGTRTPWAGTRLLCANLHA